MKHVVLTLAVVLVGTSLVFPVHAQSIPSDVEIAYLEAYLLDTASGDPLAQYGPLDWEVQMWLLAGAPFGVEMSVRIVAFDERNLPVLEGEMTGLWLDPFYGSMGLGLIYLGVEDTGIRVVSDPPFSNYGTMALYPVDPALPVDVDIKPGSLVNPLNLNARANLPVAIKGTEDFDIAWIDAASVTVAGVSVIRPKREDVTGPLGSPDGIPDLVFFVEVPALEPVLRDIPDGEIVGLVVTGMLLDETPIEGVDSVRIQRPGRHALQRGRNR